MNFNQGLKVRPQHGGESRVFIQGDVPDMGLSINGIIPERGGGVSGSHNQQC